MASRAPIGIETTPQGVADYCNDLLRTLRYMAEEQRLTVLARLIQIAELEALGLCRDFERSGADSKLGIGIER